jgi:hypothetical protein
MKLNRVYVFFIILYLSLITLSIIAFVLMPFPLSYPEGFFITPGNVQMEWIFAITMPGITGTLFGIVAIFLVSPIFVRIYTKFLSKKSRIGLVETEPISKSTLFRKIWARSIILGFFVGNICFTLAGQEAIVKFMRSVNPLEESYLIPDIETLWQIAWVITIPSALIVIPIYVMSDMGIIRAKKINGFQFMSADLASKPLYKVIKGFAGVGFIYNLAVMITFWVTASVERSGFDLTIIIEIISPLIAAGSVFPGIIILESLKSYNRRRAEKLFSKLNLNNEIRYHIDSKSAI